MPSGAPWWSPKPSSGPCRLPGRGPGDGPGSPVGPLPPGLVSSPSPVKRAPSVGAWRSLVARIVRDDEVGGSNPLAPTRLLHVGAMMQEAQSSTAIDPVCGMTVDIERATADGRISEHNGMTWYFCGK